MHTLNLSLLSIKGRVYDIAQTHRHVMCRVASFCCSKDLQKESKCQIFLNSSGSDDINDAMRPCGQSIRGNWYGMCGKEMLG